MIYITGDTHGNIDFPKLKEYFDKHYVTEKDFLIILGDAAIIWSEKENYLSDYYCLGPTVLFIDGNHENFELLNSFPVVEFKGAKCHKLHQMVYHVMRGEILNINGLSFFCMGGATSIDKARRINRVSWWEEENITNSDILNGLNNLEKVDYKVDYVLTHCAPSFVVKKMFNYSVDPNTTILERFESQINYKHWLFGHYHENKSWNKFRCLYSDIIEIKAIDSTKDIKYPILYEEKGVLYNLTTHRKIKLTITELPEWYYHSRGYYYSLKGVTDTAFVRCWTDNHLDKDARIYLHYRGKLKKNRDYEPLQEDEWDTDVWRGDAELVCLGLEKYSPELDLDRLKAAINLNYDQFNQRNQHCIVVRPFPEVDTPRYVDRWAKKQSQYVVLHGEIVLSEFISLERAEEYTIEYVFKNLGLTIFKEVIGNESSDYIKAYDTSYNMKQWVFLKRIR